MEIFLKEYLTPLNSNLEIFSKIFKKTQREKFGIYMVISELNLRILKEFGDYLSDFNDSQREYHLRLK